VRDEVREEDLSRRLVDRHGVVARSCDAYSPVESREGKLFQTESAATVCAES